MTARSRAALCRRSPAVAYCQGTPLRNEIVGRNRLGHDDRGEPDARRRPSVRLAEATIAIRQSVVLRAGGLCRGLWRLRTRENAGRDSDRPRHQRTLVSCAARDGRHLDRRVRPPLLRCRSRLACIRGGRDSAFRPRAEFPDGRQRELPGDHGAGSPAALGWRCRRRSHRCPESMGNRSPTQQSAARRVHRRCLRNPVAQGRAGCAPACRPRRRQPCRSAS